MPNYTLFQTSEYGERILLRRVFLPKGTSIEALLVYTRLLNDFPIIQAKKPLSQLSGANLSFRSYFYRDGYVLEARLSQTQSKALSYLFLDPMKEGEKILSSAFENGFQKNEKNLAVCKERILFEGQSLTSSHLAIQEMISATYCDIPFDETKIKEIKLSDIDQIASLVKTAKEGDCILFGNKDSKTDVILPSYEQELHLESQNESRAILNPNYKYLEDESMLLLFSHNTIQNTKDKATLELVLSGLKMTLEKEIKKRVFLDFTIQARILDQNHSIFVLTSYSKIDQIKEALPLIINGRNSLRIDEAYDFACGERKQKEILMHMESKHSLSTLLEEKDLNLQKEEGIGSLSDYNSLNASFLLDNLFLLRKENSRG